MQYQLDITLSEDDYLAFNHFHTFESETGRKMIRKTRTFFVSAMAVLAAGFLLVLGFTAFSVTYVILLGLFTALYMVFFKRIASKSMKAQINRMKKMGKLPFDPASRLEFYEDKLVEITPVKRIEQSYNAFERICVVGDRYIFLYTSSVGAYILPISQITAQVEKGEFLQFLGCKCGTVEYH